MGRRRDFLDLFPNQTAVLRFAGAVVRGQPDEYWLCPADNFWQGIITERPLVLTGPLPPTPPPCRRYPHAGLGNVGGSLGPSPSIDPSVYERGHRRS